MNKKRGFTLIELLVVIAIIALLMSILMPALAKVRKQALAVVCRSRLKQWGVVCSLYTSDNDGFFLARTIGDPASGYAKMWYITYKPYYHDAKMRFCPTAENRNLRKGAFGTWNADYGAWKPWDFPLAGEGDNQTQDGAYPTGSFGMNRWIEDMQGGTMATNAGFYRRADVKGGEKAPVILDCQYVYYWVTEPENDPPAYNGDYTTPEVHWACIDRHLGYTDAVYLDYSARKTGLKELWALKQGKTFDVCGPWTICGFKSNKTACKAAWKAAAPWMVNMPEY